MNIMEKNINIYEYQNYRCYLKAAYDAEKQRRKNFSLRYVAKVTGFGSSGYIKMVMDGQRNLSPNTIGQISKVFRHGKKESAFFEALVLFNQAKNDDQRQLYLERLSNLKPKTVMTELARAKYEYFTQSHFVIIRELVALPDFQDDPKWIASRLTPAIRPRDAEHAMKVLETLQLIQKNAEGRWEQTDESLATPPEIAAPEIYQYHNNMINLAKQALLHGDSQLNDVTALTIPICKKDLPQIKTKIAALREEIMSLVNNSPDKNFDEVFQLNIQCFPVTNAQRN